MSFKLNNMPPTYQQTIFFVIFNYIVSKEGKLPDPKKIAAIANMSKLKTAKNIHVFNNMAQFYCCFI